MDTTTKMCIKLSHTLLCTEQLFLNNTVYQVHRLTLFKKINNVKNRTLISSILLNFNNHLFNSVDDYVNYARSKHTFMEVINFCQNI